MHSFTSGGGVALIVLSLGASFTPGGAAVAASAYCPSPAHRDAQKAPRELGPAIAKAFDVGREAIGNGAFVRCVGAKLMACWVGANLDCGKANARRTLPGATAWCRDNPNANEVPMVATGHDTIYEWRCDGARAVAGKIMTPVDAQGYIADNWKELP